MTRLQVFLWQVGARPIPPLPTIKYIRGWLIVYALTAITALFASALVIALVSAFRGAA